MIERSRFFRLFRFFWLIVFAWIALGAVIGAVLFPLLGPLLGHRGSAMELLRHGLRFGSFYFMIWAPGLSLVLTVMKGYREKKAEPFRPAPLVDSNRT